MEVKLCIESQISERIAVRRVVNVPSELPAYKDRHDEHYIKIEPGLFPDLLDELNNSDLDVSVYYHSIWIDIKTDINMEAGIYPVTITFTNENYGISESKTFNFEVINAVLPDQELIYTEWFHADCIASYYDVEVFSEKHWMLLEKFIKTAVDNGINMLLTPIFTPPLDTMVGCERPTVQLVDIVKDGENYTFDFTKLKRWIQLCHKCGIQYFEMAHLFTQWGAQFTPKIVAYENGEMCRIFGWDTEALSDRYANFLKQFLPVLTSFLKKEGIDKKTYFHVSDEPNERSRDTYGAAKKVLGNMLNDFVVFDALSDYQFYETGLVRSPVPSNDHIELFLENKVPDLWTYTCCWQCISVSNRLMSMPSYRNRILGMQMYKYGIVGFLHWGYNFYYSQFSKQLINPFITTDALGAFPSGDAFAVYPGTNGPLESIRLKVFKYALQDMQAMKYLESLMPREDIIDILDSEMPITFMKYPQSAEFILTLREKINKIIKNSLDK